MADKDVQIQINEINNKLDLLLNYVNEQRLKSQAVEDLISDASIIGKDMFDDAVTTLDKQQVSIDPEAIQLLAIKFLKNVDNFHNVMSLFESASDFVKDAEPIFNEVMIDTVKTLHRFEERGYFDFIADMTKALDNGIMAYKDIDMENIPPMSMWKLMREMNSPEMKKALGFMVTFLKNVSKK